MQTGATIRKITLFLIVCPIEDSKYRLIDGICFFYESTRLNYDTAKANCETKFDGNGRLYEPRSLDTMKKVRETGVANDLGNFPWIGINDISEEGTWVYTSDGSTVSISIPWGSGYYDYGSRGTSYNCVLFGWLSGSNSDKVMDLGCNYGAYPSICEPDL